MRTSPLAITLLLLGAPVLAQTEPAPAVETEVAPPPTDPPADDLAARVEDLETELLLLRAEANAVSDKMSEDDPIRLYGYLEVGLQKMFFDRDGEANAVIQTRATTFALGAVNLYFDARPARGWNVLIETRLTLAPNGQDEVGGPGRPYQRTSTTLFDPGGAGAFSEIKWSGIVLERAYIQYTRSEAFALRAGLFLTPSGIWNEDHGSPTLIPMVLPQSMIIQQFPIRQLGVQVLGGVDVSRWHLGYSGYVSNGRTAVEVDFTEDKALGGRVTLTAPRPLKLTVGASVYVGRYSDQERSIVAFDPVTVERTETVAYGETTFGVDASLDVGNWRLRSELGGRVVRYEDGKRAQQWGRSGVYVADHVDIDWYGLAAWRPSRLIEPYVFLEIYRWPTTISEGFVMPSVGVNLHFTPTTQLKLQAAANIFCDFSELKVVSGDQEFLWTGARLVQAF